MRSSKYLQLVFRILLLFIFLVGCASPTTVLTPSPKAPPTGLTPTAVMPTAAQPTSTLVPIITPTVSALMPGDKIGQMSIENSTSDIETYLNYCQRIFSDKPSEWTTECTMSWYPELEIGEIWGAIGKALLDSNWNGLSWELYFDNHAVNLNSFSTKDVDQRMDDGTLINFRVWKVKLVNPTPGKHTVHYVVHFNEEMYDGFSVYKAGLTHEMVLNLTLIKPPAECELTTILTCPTLNSTPQKGQHAYTSQKSLNYLLYVPEDYGKDAQKKWPIILFLHWLGAQGNNLNMVRGGGLPKKLESETNFTFLVASPQLLSANDNWSDPDVAEQLFSLLEELQTNLSVDPQRIYLTGVSLGGKGTWEVGLKYPGHFAALVPVAGFWGWPPSLPDNICDLLYEPIWAFHGAKDETIQIDAEEGLVNALKACGGNPEFTVYPEGTHDIGDQVYATPELYTWMLEQVLK